MFLLDPKVVTFFYGSYINPTVLREVDLVPQRVEVARLPGFDISRTCRSHRRAGPRVRFLGWYIERIESFAL